MIKGLPEILEDIKRTVTNASKSKKGGGGGGGGMGNAVTGTIPVNSSTTSITLPSKVASNGGAIWLNYQGQQQARDTHFTSNGSTIIPLLFTPDDVTFIDYIYIRK